jgi:hypothetical protein
LGDLELNRRGRRRLRGEGIGHVSRVATGTSEHFAEWKKDRGGGWKDRKKVEKYLRQMTLEWLAEQLDAKGGGDNLAMGRTLRKLQPKYANVLELSRGEAADILAVPTVGRVGVAKLEAYLRQHRVPLSWTVDRGN